MSKKNAMAYLVATTIVVAGGAYFLGQMDESPDPEPSVTLEDNKKDDVVAKQAAKLEYKKGEHYIEIDPVYGLPSKSVVEVLWYGCPHCYKMEDVVKSDEFKEKSQSWNFQQIHLARKDGPVGFDFKVYAALKQMGLDKTVGKEYMKAIHEDGLDRGQFEGFAKEHGLSIESVKSLSENSEAESYFNFSSQFSDRDGFEGVPSFVVAGRYIINNRYNIADVANFLLDKEDSEKSE